MKMKQDTDFQKPSGPEGQHRSRKRRRYSTKFPVQFGPLSMTWILTTVFIVILSCQLTIVPVSGYYFTFSNPLNWSWFNWYARTNQTAFSTNNSGANFTLTNLTQEENPAKPMFQSLKMEQSQPQLPLQRKKTKKSYELSEDEKDLKVDLYLTIKKITEANNRKREAENLALTVKATTELPIFNPTTTTEIDLFDKDLALTTSLTLEHNPESSVTTTEPEILPKEIEEVVEETTKVASSATEANLVKSVEFRNYVIVDNDQLPEVNLITTQSSVVVPEESSTVHIPVLGLLKEEETELSSTTTTATVLITKNAVIKLLLKPTNRSLVEESGKVLTEPQQENTSHAKEEKPVFILFDQSNLTEDYGRQEVITEQGLLQTTTELPEMKWDRMEVRTEISRNSIVENSNLPEISASDNLLQHAEQQLPNLAETLSIVFNKNSGFGQTSTSTEVFEISTTTETPEVGVNQTNVDHQNQFIKELLALRTRADDEKEVEKEEIDPKPIYDENWKQDEEVDTEDKQLLTSTLAPTSTTTTLADLIQSNSNEELNSTTTTTQTTTVSTNNNKKKANKMLLGTDSDSINLFQNNVDGGTTLFNVPNNQMMDSFMPVSGINTGINKPQNPASNNRFLQNFQNFYSSSAIFDDLMQQYSSGSGNKEIFGSNFIDPNDLNSISFSAIRDSGSDQQLNSNRMSSEQLMLMSASK